MSVFDLSQSLSFRGALLLAAGLSVAASGAASATDVSVTIENVQGDGGYFFTPFWGAFHNGQFDVYSSGEAASNFPGLEALAEDGNIAPFSAAFNSSPAQAAGGIDFIQAAADIAPPPFEPGESSTQTYDVGDSSVNRYFSYASMLIPSNDIFVGNANPFGIEVFDVAGNFNGEQVIEIFGSSLRDAGTEVNDINGGAAFSANGGTSTSEALLISTFDSSNALPDYLNIAVNGTDTVTGATINTTVTSQTLLARIVISQGDSVIPAPSAAAGSLGLMGLLLTRRRR